MCMHSIFKRLWVECTSLSHYLFVYMWVGVCGERCLVTFRLLQLVVCSNTTEVCACYYSFVNFFRFAFYQLKSCWVHDGWCNRGTTRTRFMCLYAERRIWRPASETEAFFRGALFSTGKSVRPLVGVCDSIATRFPERGNVAKDVQDSEEHRLKSLSFNIWHTFTD